MVDLITPLETAGSAFLGGVTSGTEWRTDAGKISPTMVAVNVATAIVIAEIIGGLCDVAGMFGYIVSIKIQLGLCAVGGYVGPKAVVTPIYAFILKRFGGGA